MECIFKKYFFTKSLIRNSMYIGSTSNTVASQKQSELFAQEFPIVGRAIVSPTPRPKVLGKYHIFRNYSKHNSRFINGEYKFR